MLKKRNRRRGRRRFAVMAKNYSFYDAFPRFVWRASNSFYARSLRKRSNQTGGGTGRSLRCRERPERFSVPQCETQTFAVNEILRNCGIPQLRALILCGSMSPHVQNATAVQTERGSPFKPRPQPSQVS